MSVNVKVKKRYGESLVVRFTTRIGSAKSMLELTRKLRTEQETEGPWDELYSDLNTIEDVGTHVKAEFFEGISDVIFEATVVITVESKSDLDVTSERVAGTILSQFTQYMGWGYYDFRLENDYESKYIKELLVFKG